MSSIAEGVPPAGDIEALKAACAPFLGAESPERYEAVADGTLSDAEVAAVPLLFTLAQAEGATLADRTAAAAGLCALFDRGNGSEQVVGLATATPGESIVEGALMAVTVACMRWLGAQPQPDGSPAQPHDIDPAGVRLHSWFCAVISSDFRGLGFTDHADHHHHSWDFFYGAVPAAFGLAAQMWSRADAAIWELMPERLLTMMRHFHSIAVDEDGHLSLRSGAMFNIGLVFVAMTAFPWAEQALVSVAATLVNEGLCGSVQNILELQHRRGWRDNCGLMCVDYCLQHAIKSGGLDLTLAEGPMPAVCSFLIAHIQQMAAPSARPHVLEAKSAAQALGRIALAPGGRALLRGQSRLSETMLWLLEHAESIGKNHTIDPAAAAGSVLAVLFGRMEDAAHALPERAVVKLCKWFEVMLRFSPAMAIEPCQGLVEVAVSDAHKLHMLRSDVLVDTLHRGLSADVAAAEVDPNQTKLRVCCCAVLAQLSTLPATAAMLVGHPVLKALAALSNHVEPTVARDIAVTLFQIDLIEAEAEKTVCTGATQEGVRQAPSAGDHLIGHVMISYQWDVQTTIKRLNVSLQHRGFRTWIDIECMAGSTVTAMADAIDQAACVVYAVTEKYKESANCRMELNYAMQSQLNLIPLMLEEDYVPRGWLGLILGTKLWFAFYGDALASDASFETAVDAVVRELGDRGHPSAAPPSVPSSARLLSHSTPAPAPSVAAPAALQPKLYLARHRAVATAAELQIVQGRLLALGTTGLLTAAELDTLDDLVADFVAGANESEKWVAAQKVANMVELSVAFADDARLARQLRRCVIG